MKKELYIVVLVGCSSYANYDGIGIGNEGGSTSIPADVSGKTASEECSCSFPGAVGICVNDVCVIDYCLEGFENCNGDDSDGCETAIASNPLACGGCNNVCKDISFSDSVCYAGECSCRLNDIGICYCVDADHGDCDESRNNGCETNFLSHNFHCGSCDKECKNSAFCDNGSCHCNNLPSYIPGHGIQDCLACISDNCCLFLQACLNSTECYLTWNYLVSCKEQSPDGCAFSPENTNIYWQNMRACVLSNECGSSCGY